jgi:hypothetical protein
VLQRLREYGGLFPGEAATRSQAHGVVYVPKGIRLIEVIDTSDESTLCVPPGTEVLHVKIADAQDLGSSGNKDTFLAQLLALRFPKSCPAVERSTEEGEDAFLAHSPVFALSIVFDDRCPLS